MWNAEFSSRGFWGICLAKKIFQKWLSIKVEFGAIFNQMWVQDGYEFQNYTVYNISKWLVSSFLIVYGQMGYQENIILKAGLDLFHIE